MLEKFPCTNFYKQHLHSFKLQAGAPFTFLAGMYAIPLLYKGDIITLLPTILIGIGILFFSTVHIYLVKTLTTDEKQKLVEEIETLTDIYDKGMLEAGEKYDRETNRLSDCINGIEVQLDRACYNRDIIRHLIKVTNHLVNWKRKTLLEEAPVPQERFDKCIDANLLMLNAFYRLHQPDVNFTIVLFVPSESPIIDDRYTSNKLDKGEEYLIPYTWFNENYQAPVSVGNPANYPTYYSRSSVRLVCRSWRAKDIIVIEDAEKEGYPTYHAKQKNYLKSMIAYPVLTPDTNEVRAVICFIANKPSFFKRSQNNIEFHRFIFDHVATRINLEFADFETPKVRS
jgi:hypothetical protein